MERLVASGLVSVRLRWLLFHRKSQSPFAIFAGGIYYISIQIYFFSRYTVDKLVASLKQAFQRCHYDKI